ncbi:MAG: 50S ribosomal protein L11 methyltransferase [Micavibrio sp.]|nr:50S ribosomal protein L11 methyltransferase [Micavibrio sp.]
MYKLSVKLPSHITDEKSVVIGRVFDDLCSAHSAMREKNHDGAPWVFEWLIEDIPSESDCNARMAVLDELHDLELGSLVWESATVPERNWLEYSYSLFPPFSVGPFFIYGSHFDGSVPEGQMGLQIDAATAFGSGEHGTTKGCLQAMLELKAQGQCPWNILDMGTGSGILAIAAWKLWNTPVLGVDNDAESVRVAGVHRDSNQVPSGKGELALACGDGFKTPEVHTAKPFDLIIANILAGPLMEMADELVSVSDEKGYVILSGILNEQAEQVIESYEGVGLELKKKFEIGEWSTLVLKKP